MKRQTLTEKWEDPWFIDLTPSAKLLFLYFADKVDNAGFFQLSPKHLYFETGLSSNDYVSAIKELMKPVEGKKKVILHKGYIYLPTFLKAQSNYPLKSNNNCHRSISKIEDGHYHNNFHDCDCYKRPERLEVNGKPWEVDVVTVEPKPKQEPVKTISTKEPLQVASRLDLRNAKQDWKAIRQACMNNMNLSFRSEPLYKLMGEWWDHMYESGNPYQVGQWTRLCSYAETYGPHVIAEAIRYSMGSNKTTLNFDMAKKFHHEMPSPVKVPVEKNPPNWDEAFRQVFPDARLVHKPKDLPPKKREQVETKRLAISS